MFGNKKKIFGRKPKVVNRILALIDWENVYSNSLDKRTGISLETGFNKWNKQLREIGEVVMIFIFCPSHLVTSHGRYFYDQGFFLVDCVRIMGKDRSTRDTADDQMTQIGLKLIQEIPTLTHIAIGSGDIDFKRVLVNESIRKGLKIIFLPGARPDSHSRELLKLADTHPTTQIPMVFPFTTPE